MRKLLFFLSQNEGTGLKIKKQRLRLRARMGDVSAFVKTLKQRYSMSYNARNKRTGTLWEERIKSVLVENSERAKAAAACLGAIRASGAPFFRAGLEGILFCGIFYVYEVA